MCHKTPPKVIEVQRSKSRLVLQENDSKTYKATYFVKSPLAAELNLKVMQRLSRKSQAGHTFFPLYSVEINPDPDPYADEYIDLNGLCIDRNIKNIVVQGIYKIHSIGFLRQEPLTSYRKDKNGHPKKTKHKKTLPTISVKNTVYFEAEDIGISKGNFSFSNIDLLYFDGFLCENLEIKNCKLVIIRDTGLRVKNLSVNNAKLELTREEWAEWSNMSIEETTSFENAQFQINSTAHVKFGKKLEVKKSTFDVYGKMTRADKETSDKTSVFNYHNKFD